MTKKHKPGTVPDGRIAIRSHTGAIVGHVGPHAVAGTVMRFGIKNPELKTVNGRYEWHGASAPRPTRPPENANVKAARGSAKPV